MPRIKKEFVAHEDVTQVGQDNPRVMKSTGPAEESLEPQEIEVVPGPINKDKADMLAFMEEPLEIFVHESTDPNAEPIVYVGVNGRTQYFVRGQVQTVKRKFVEKLARCKVTRYSQQYIKDGNGADAIKNIPHTSLAYPFSVVHDPNPRGAAWLRKVLAEG